MCSGQKNLKPPSALAPQPWSPHLGSQQGRGSCAGPEPGPGGARPRCGRDPCCDFFEAPPVGPTSALPLEGVGGGSEGHPPLATGPHPSPARLRFRLFLEPLARKGNTPGCTEPPRCRKGKALLHSPSPTCLVTSLIGARWFRPQPGVPGPHLWVCGFLGIWGKGPHPLPRAAVSASP